MNEYPKQLYRSGWDDLTDTIVVQSADGEGDARAAGFKMLGEADAEPDEEAESKEDAPKPRRGRPPKAAE